MSVPAGGMPEELACHGLGRHQTYVKQGAGAGQKTATVQCHCLIIEETLSRQLGLAGLLAAT